MNKIKKLFSYIPKDIYKKQWFWIPLLLLITILYLMHSCTSTPAGKRKEVYTIGRDSTWYPLQLLGRERSLTAFTNDLLSEIARENNVRFIWVETGPGSPIEGLDSNTFDAIVTSLRPNIVNQEKYLFSELFFEMGPVLIVREDSPITSLREMHGHLIGIEAGTSLIFNAIRQSGANVYDLDFIFYNNINKAVDALMNDQIDGIIMAALPAYTTVEGFYAGKLKIVTSPLTDEGLRLVARKSPDSEILIKGFNSTLDKLKEDGAYNAMIQKWHLIDPEKPFHHSKR